MVTTASIIIHNAFRKIGLNSSDRNLSGDKIQTGLNYLNALFRSYLTDTQIIAYNDVISFSLVVGQREYIISKEVGADVDNNMIVELKHVNLLFQNIRYPVQIVTDRYFYEVQRDQTLQLRPDNVFLQNGINKSTLNFIVKSDKTYTCEVKAKFFRNQVLMSEINNDLLEFPTGYDLFFEYELARILNDTYPGSVWTAKNEKIYLELKGNIESTSDIDVEIESSSALLIRGDRFTPRLNVIT